MLDIISINPLKTRQVFIHNADPDESDTMFQFNSKKLVDKSTSVSLAALVDSDDLGDDDDDYNPGGYEAVYCIGKYVFHKKILRSNIPKENSYF